MSKRSGGIIGNIFGGIIAGIILIIVGVILLWYNEGRTIKTSRSINEAEKEMISVSSDSIDSDNEGKLIATTGKLTYSSEGVTDYDFDIYVQTAKLVRKVEMYQWEESCDEDDNCSYKQVWKEDRIDSSKFDKETGHVNPELDYENRTFYAEDIKVGAFELDSFKEYLSATSRVSIKDSNVTGFYVNNNYLVDYSGNPEVGSVRISYYLCDAKEVSVLAVQKGDSFAKYKAENGYEVYSLVNGSQTGSEMIEGLRSSNNMMKWILRLLGWLLNVIGFIALFSPLQKTIGRIPLIGSVVNGVTGLIGGLIGTAVSFVVIAVSWFAYRPLLSVCLLGGTAILLIGVKVLSSKKKNPDVVQQPVVPSQNLNTTPMPTNFQQSMVQQPVPQNMQPQQPVMQQQVVQPQVQPQQPMMQQQVVQPQQQPVDQNNNINGSM